METHPAGAFSLLQEHHGASLALNSPATRRTHIFEAEFLCSHPPECAYALLSAGVGRTWELLSPVAIRYCDTAFELPSSSQTCAIPCGMSDVAMPHRPSRCNVRPRSILSRFLELLDSSASPLMRSRHMSLGSRLACRLHIHMLRSRHLRTGWKTFVSSCTNRSGLFSSNHGNAAVSWHFPDFTSCDFCRMLLRHRSSALLDTSLAPAEESTFQVETAVPGRYPGKIALASDSSEGAAAASDPTFCCYETDLARAIPSDWRQPCLLCIVASPCGHARDQSSGLASLI